MPKYRVDRYYSTYRSFEVEAESEEDATDAVEASSTDVNLLEDAAELIDNLERWSEADTVEKIEE